MHLADALGLRPLDRVQINDARQIRESRFDAQMGYRHPDLPYWYFQRALPDGRAEVRAPSGYAANVELLDICDIVQGEPLIVRAMPRQEFARRLRLPYQERSLPADAQCYREAHVLCVSKDRWGRVDETYVWFTDPALNADRAWSAPIHPEDKPLVERKARRTYMPVLGKGSANDSADHGMAAQRDMARCVSTGFLRLALRGNRATASALAEAGLRRMTRPELFRLCGPVFR